MKRSKIFLGASSLILAVAAIAATKAKQTTTVKGYYSIGNQRCTVLGSLSACTTQSGNQCTINVAGTSTPLFTYAKGICAHEVFKPQ